MLRCARDRDMIISVILHFEDDKAQPAAGSEDERRYFRYAAARLSSFSNITWDLGDDLDSYRDEKWAHELGRCSKAGTPTNTWRPATPSTGSTRTAPPTGSGSLRSRNGPAPSTS